MIQPGELKKKVKPVVDIPDDASGQPAVAPILLGFVLDASGSMQGLKPTVISGFNEYLQSHRDNPMGRLVLTTLGGNVRLGTVQPVAQATELTTTNYNPEGGTPLYDAIKETLELIDKEAHDEEARLVVFLTDGENNQGTTTREEVRQLVEKFTATKKWTFVYVGANQDAWAVARDIGVSAGNTLSYNSTVAGTTAANSSVRRMSDTYRRTASRSFAMDGTTMSANSANLRSASGITTCLVCGGDLPTNAVERHDCPGAPAQS